MEAESRIAIESDADVVTARQRARELAGELELSSTDQTLLATAISEVARNITTYAIRGEVHAADRARRQRPLGHRGRRRPTTGRGSRTSSARCRTATRPAAGSGSGCPGARRLVDEFEIESAPEQGTTVRLVKWSRAAERGVRV